MNKRQIEVAVGATLIVLGFAASGWGGYILGRRKAGKEFEELFTEEIENIRDHYAMQYKAEYATPEEAVKALIGEEQPEVPVSPALVQKIIREAKDRTDYNAISTKYQGTDTPPATVESNIWDKRQAVPPRGPDGRFIKQEPGEVPNEDPYIIDVKDFLQNDTEYDQEEVTYHWRDDTVLDAQGDTVEGDILGEVNLSLFKSDVEHDPELDHTMYIRNEKITMEYCVVISEESVAAMHGLDQDN